MKEVAIKLVKLLNLNEFGKVKVRLRERSLGLAMVGLAMVGLDVGLAMVGLMVGLGWWDFGHVTS